METKLRDVNKHQVFTSVVFTLFPMD